MIMQQGAFEGVSMARLSLPANTMSSATVSATSLLNLRYEDTIGWVTDLSGKRFRLDGKLFEVHAYFPNVDRYYCPEVMAETQSLMIEFQVLLAGCLWPTSVDLAREAIAWV